MEYNKSKLENDPIKPNHYKNGKMEAIKIMQNALSIFY